MANFVQFDDHCELLLLWHSKRVTLMEIVKVKTKNLHILHMGEHIK